MMKTSWIAIVLAVGLSGSGCSKKKDSDSQPAAGAKGTEPAAGAKADPAAGAKVDPAPTPAPAPAAGGSVDFSSPTKVTEAVFAAAASGKTDQLASLCDPKGENDGDTKDICGLTASSEKFAEFKEYFAKGKATKETITGDDAEVAILFGPDGTKDETMKLVRRDGKWYLAGF